MARVTYPAIPPDPDDPQGSPGRPAGEPFEVADNDQVLLDYYRGEGATVELGVYVVARGSMEFDGEQYLEVVDVVELPDGELVTADTVVPAMSASRADWEQAAHVLGITDEAIAAASNKDQLIGLVEAAVEEAATLPDHQTHPGYGEPLVGIEQPADGTLSPAIGNE